MSNTLPTPASPFDAGFRAAITRAVTILRNTAEDYRQVATQIEKSSSPQHEEAIQNILVAGFTDKAELLEAQANRIETLVTPPPFVGSRSSS